MNNTILKFGYPDSLVGELGNWTVLLRPRQVTIGSLVLACSEEISSFSQLSPESAMQIPMVMGKIEEMFKSTLNPPKINFLALMMMDPHVHFHVIPRYEFPKEIFGVSSVDNGWPKGPKLGEIIELTKEQEVQLLSLLRSAWTD